MQCPFFQKLHHGLYTHKIVFSFNWMKWHVGGKNLNNQSFDYSNCSLLEISMYLTTIFRGDRFNSGLINEFYKNGTLTKIFNALDMRVKYL
jgi:hypothetical protein